MGAGVSTSSFLTSTRESNGEDFYAIRYNAFGETDLCLTFTY